MKAARVDTSSDVFRQTTTIKSVRNTNNSRANRFITQGKIDTFNGNWKTIQVFPTLGFLLKENGDYLLLESGDKLGL